MKLTISTDSIFQWLSEDLPIIIKIENAKLSVILVVQGTLNITLSISHSPRPLAAGLIQSRAKWKCIILGENSASQKVLHRGEPLETTCIFVTRVIARPCTKCRKNGISPTYGPKDVEVLEGPSGIVLRAYLNQHDDA